jgi:hypothetical protein
MNDREADRLNGIADTLDEIAHGIGPKSKKLRDVILVQVGKLRDLVEDHEDEEEEKERGFADE